MFLFAVDDFVGQSLGDGLLGSETVVSDSVAEEVDGLVDSSHGRNVDGLLLDLTSGSDSGRVFSGAGQHDGSDEDLKRVSSSEEVDDFEGVSDDSDGFEFLTGVSTVELHGSDESFDDGTQGLSEFLGLISAGSVGDEDLAFAGLDRDVIDEAGIVDLLLQQRVLSDHRRTIWKRAWE